MMFLMSPILLSGWIAVVYSITLMGVDFMDPVISRNAWCCALSHVYIADFDADDSVVDPYSNNMVVLFRYIIPQHCFCSTPLGSSQFSE